MSKFALCMLCVLHSLCICTTYTVAAPIRTSTHIEPGPRARENTEHVPIGPMQKKGVGQAMSDAVSTLSEKLGAAVGPTREGVTNEDGNTNSTSKVHGNDKRNDTHERVVKADGSDAVSCDTGECLQLGEEILTAIEGQECRALLVTGKCPIKCMQSISAVTSNAAWPSCASTCKKDIVTGATERWAALCGARQVTLLDQGKEAVKSLVGVGIMSKLRLAFFMQIIFAVLVLALAVAYGYRKGLIQGHTNRLQKRMHARRRSLDRVFV